MTIKHTEEHEKIGRWPVNGCVQCQKDYILQLKLVSIAARGDPGEEHEGEVLKQKEA